MKKVVLALVLFLQVISFGCSSKPAESQSKETASSSPAPAAEQKMEFNSSDKNIVTNNNMGVAAFKVKDEPAGSLFNKAEAISASKLTKSPYSCIGKIYKLTGEVYKVEELPPSLGLKGKWSELLMMVGNRNSPMGATTVDFIFNGDVDKIESGQVVTCSGYFIGTFESPNAVGGTVEAVTFVGNSVKRR